MTENARDGDKPQPSGAPSATPRELAARLKKLFDDTGDRTRGSYPDRVGEALLAVYAEGQRSQPKWPHSHDVEVVVLPNGEQWAAAGPVGRYVKTLVAQPSASKRAECCGWVETGHPRCPQCPTPPSSTAALKYTDAIVDAPRMLIAYADTTGRTLKGLREHLEAAGVEYKHCWPDWAYENGHLNKSMIAELVHRMMEAVRTPQPYTDAPDAVSSWFEWRDKNPDTPPYEIFLAAYELGRRAAPSAIKPAVPDGMVLVSLEAVKVAWSFMKHRRDELFSAMRDYELAEKDLDTLEKGGFCEWIPTIEEVRQAFRDADAVAQPTEMGKHK